MAFHEIQFPADISYGCTGGPQFLTGIVTPTDWAEQRVQQWEQPRRKYNVSQAVKNYAQYGALLAFFMNRAGRAHGFRFKDWLDYTAFGQLCIVANPEYPLVYQLQKKYTDAAGYSSIRTIKKPVAGTVTVYKDHILMTDAYTVDYTKGHILFAADPAPAVITADFEFDVPCRFASDEMPSSMDTDACFSWNSVEIVEIKG